MNDAIAPVDRSAPPQDNTFAGNNFNPVDLLQSRIDAKPVAAGLDAGLPKLELTDAPPAQDWLHDAMSVAWDLGVGAVNQVTQHPLETLGMVGVGAVIGVAGTLCAPIAIGAGIVGAGVLGYEAITHGGEIIDDVNKIANQENFTKAEVDKAHEDIQGLGGGIAKAVAGVAGGMVASYATGAIIAAENASVAAAQAADEAWSAEVDAKLASILGPKNASGEAFVPVPEPPFVGIDINGTTMTLADKAAWTEMVNANPEGYGNAILTYANRWATMMEQHIAAGEPLTGGNALSISNAADEEGITGAMFGAARNLLIKTWKFGPDLAKALEK